MVIKFLNESFVLKVSAPQSCLPLLNTVDGVIIRNIWPTHEYAEEWEDVKTYLRASDLPIYNPLGWKGDIEGKNYLVTLYSKGYPVIPSVDRVSDIGQIPRVEHYWIKPKKSCDGIGAKRVTRDELYRMNPHGYIIQPFLEFEYEPSFFFVDGQFHHAISTPHRLLDDRVVRYAPSLADLEFATRLARWTDFDYGIQRIDAVRTKDGILLLTEIENLCPYLYLGEVDPTTRQSFLDSIRKSMSSVFVR